MKTRSQRLSMLLLLPLLGLAVPAYAQEKLIQMTVGLGEPQPSSPPQTSAPPPGVTY